MKRSIILSLGALLCAFTGGLFWLVATRDVDLADILQRSDLRGTSLSYSWTGLHTLGDGSRDVHAFFSGDGEATLQVGDESLIRIELPDERYRNLLKGLANNRFTEIQVCRRWGLYLCDAGRLELILRDGRRRTMLYVDAKHYVDQPELLEPMLAAIYEFDKDFGRGLDNRPFGWACIRDTTEMVVGGVVAIGVLAVATTVLVLSLLRRSRTRAESESKGTQDRRPAPNPSDGADAAKPSEGNASDDE